MGNGLKGARVTEEGIYAKSDWSWYNQRMCLTDKNFWKIFSMLTLSVTYCFFIKMGNKIFGSIYHDNDEIWGGSLFVGVNATNNRAEYSGLILGLQKALEMNIKEIHVQGDSLLVVNQMTGKYKCNSPNLLDLHDTAKALEKGFVKVHYEHILRNFNKRADELSNIAVKDYTPNRPAA